MSRPPINLLGFDRVALRRFFEDLGERPYRADQALQWIHQHGMTEFDSMTNLSKALRAKLKETTCLEAPSVVSEQVSDDGTRKWLLQLEDGNSIEMVFIPEDDRGTLCISSQVGCALNCTFCSTARHGYNRNLTSAEMIGQIWRAHRLLESSDKSDRVITNVVFMGMGEPLLNFDNVVSTLSVLLDDFGYGLSRRRVTLSTAGVVPKIDELRRICPVSLAISLHAPSDGLRDKLVPLNRKYPVAALIDACRRYVADESRSRITFEYVMIAGLNDSQSNARELIRVLRGVPAKVNLIPFNPVPGVDFRRSDPVAIDRFRDQLLAAGIMTITRKTRGDDIDAACGQLAGKFLDRTQRSVRRQQFRRTADSLT